MKFIQTAQRVSANDLSDNFVFQRSILAYAEAAKLVSGTVLEIGTGSGYGLEIISSKTERFITIDKNHCINECKLPDNTLFIKMKAPRLRGFADNSIDYVISFQLIEHIKQDELLIKEISRVLKKGGKLILSTPNKSKSLTRNPWHVREYNHVELETLLKLKFHKITKLGVAGNDKILAYYEQNRLSVEKITRYDIFNLQYALPRQLLQIPYDIFNRLNRKRLLKSNLELVTKIKMEDYSIREADEHCIDLFFIAEK